MPQYDLVVAIPLAGRLVTPEWALSLLAMNRPLNMNNTIMPVKGLERGQARTELCRKARFDFGAKYILMIDDDTAPPSDGLLKLLYELENAPPEVKVCAGIYVSKTSVPVPLVFENPGHGPYWDWTVGEVFECHDFIATGFMLIRADVFDTLPEPWFRDVSSVEEARSLDALDDVQVPHTMIWDFQMTDDAFFCRKLRKHGYKLLAHGGVLPIHWGQDGKAHALRDDSPPVRRFYLQEANARKINIEKALAIDGWMNVIELIWLAEQAKTHTRIVEIGCYKGRSTRALVDNTEGVVTAIDHWNGPKELLVPALTQEQRDELFDVFMVNMDGVNGKVKVKRMDHDKATVDFTPDMVFIDGGHDYEEVKRDILRWRPVMRGMLCGHDADWPGVQKAVKELLPNVQYVPGTNLWFSEV